MGACLSAALQHTHPLDVESIGDLRRLGHTLSSRPRAARKANARGETLLHLAAVNGNPSAVRMLHEAGADPQATDSLGRTPLHVAALSGHKASLMAMLEAGARVNTADSCGQTALLVAANQGHASCLRALLSAGAAAHAADATGWTAVHAAARSGRVECLRELLERGSGVDVDAADRHGRTPLALCAAAGMEACLQALLAAGASTSAASSDGRTPLLRAAGAGQAACLRELLAAGADVRAVDNSGWTALHWAAAGGHVSCLTELLAADGGGLLDVADLEGLTALHATALYGSLAAIRCLVEAGANVSAACAADGRQPWQLAQAAGHAEAAQLLQELAAPPAGKVGLAGRPGAEDSAEHLVLGREPAGEKGDGNGTGSGMDGSTPQEQQAAAAALSQQFAAPQSGSRSMPQAAHGPPGGADSSSSAVLGGSNESSGSAVGAGACRALHAAERQQLVSRLRPWEIQFEELELERTLGQGSFGRVILARWHETQVAVKVLLDLQPSGAVAQLTLSSPLLAELHKEGGVMAALRHPNCVQLMGVCASPAAIVTEYCGLGSLCDVLAKARSNPALAARQLHWARRLHMAMDAAKGMLYLHSRSILHRDLKSPNLLVTHTWAVKVADFNLSRAAAGLSSKLSSAGAVNPRWLAPEVLAGGRSMPESDIFSFGIVLWELLCWELPWSSHAANPWQLAATVTAGGRPRVPPREELPGSDTMQFDGLDAYIALMRQCWNQDTAARPSFRDIIAELRSLLRSVVKTVGSRAAASTID